MLAFKPLHTPASVCPQCQGTNAGFENYDFYGQHILSKGACTHCGVEYVHNWPVAHGALFPITFTNNGIAQYPAKSAVWMAQPLISSYKSGQEGPGMVSRIQRRAIQEGLLINCLDPCYGHIIWKLLNTWSFRDLPLHQGLVVVIPENCTWMVPDFVAEVWQVQTPLSKLHHRVPGLNEMIANTFQGRLQIPPQSSQPDHAAIDLLQYFKTDKFPLLEFNKMPLKITFIWREDRLWIPDFMQPIWYFFTKFKWTLGLKLLAFIQKYRFERLATKLKRIFPDVDIAVVGLGLTGKFRGVEDLRTASPNEATEYRWCKRYAHSQLVVGVHGSSMLIPTALAAGFIALIPNFKIPFLGEDILLNHPPRYQTYLGRHLSQGRTPSQVARHIKSMCQGFDHLLTNAGYGS